MVLNRIQTLFCASQLIVKQPKTLCSHYKIKKEQQQQQQKISQNGHYLYLYSRRSNEALALIKIQAEVKEEKFQFIWRESVYYGIINLL